MRKIFFSWRMMQLLLPICCMLFFSSLGALAQNSISIKGQVVDAGNQESLIGVSILEKGTTNGTITDMDGNFTLQVASGSTVVFSYIGYKSVEMKASEVKGVIKLSEDSKTLQEVVVVGYGVQKKVNLSGAVSAIEGDKIANKPTTDVLTALQGEVPGLQVLRSSGEPGAETSGMRIRGFSSANSTSTLVLIDGVEGDMTLLNPNDIASVSVLKDAAACAIYGARAAAGVVLITTKNGSEGKVRLNYNGYVGFNLPGAMPERVTAWEEQEMINESRRQANGNPEWNPEQSSWVGNPNFNYRPNNTNGRWDLFQSTNWVAEGTRDFTTQQSHNVSLSGGKKELNYLLSAGYYTKNGILKYGPDSNDRYNLRMKINSELNKHISLSMLASYEGKFLEQNPNGSKWLLSRLFRVRGRQPIYNPEEDINDSPYNGDLQQNAIDLMKNGGITKSQYESFTGKGELNIKDYFIKGLGLKLSASRRAGYYSQTINRRTVVWNDRLGTTVRFQYNNPNSMERKKNNDYHDNFEALLTYHGDFKKHGVDAMAGTSYERYRKDEMSGTVKNLNNNDFFSFNYYDNSEATNTTVSDNIETWAIMSYFGRINYNFADRYLLEANVRYDGSSRLAPDKRWHAFPSFSAAWRVNEEKWFDVPVISNFKLRASWGQLGNGAILGLYDYIAKISRGLNMGEAGYYQSEMASVDKTWEIITSTNIGLDMGLFNNKLNITADYYWKKNDNMLADVTLPHIVGITVPKSNVGTLKTWGWEFEISYRNKFKDLEYNVSFNLSDSDNKVTHYDGKNAISAGSVDILEGYPLNTIWGYKTDGLWQSREEYEAYKKAHPGYQSFNDAKVSGGDVKYLAQGDGCHTVSAGGGTPDNPGDLVYLGSSNGRYMYGLNLGLKWRGFDFSIMFQGVAKRKVLIEASQLAPFAGTADMPWTIHRDYWTEDNPNAYWPRLFSANTFNYNPSDRWVQDASYIRLKNLSLGYTIPLKKFKIDQCRIYVNGNDLWEHTNMLKVFDPEVGNKPSANYYPFFRTWTIGLNITL
ncbi:TonB-dependent receptor [uncultured Bacteroides sp.]|uniref:SusC/RagA family TonB-linked outer membrane protein n=1 Tax=uncultured Bacteroides sp. TaxID=162156 RepID=UPI00260A4AA8|nr:TonB-dependent receptor [uncultured Bacteroides sp.]